MQAVRLLTGAETGIGKMIQTAMQVLGTRIDTGLLDSIPSSEETNLGWEWVGVLDKRICPHCEFFVGHRYTEEFEPVDNAPDLEMPPLHPNCRCQLVPVDLDEEFVSQDTQLDNFLAWTKKTVRDTVFGKAASDAYDSGKIGAESLLDLSNGHELSPDNLAEIRKIWNETE